MSQLISREEFIKMAVDSGLTFRQAAPLMTKLFEFVRENLEQGNTIRFPKSFEVSYKLKPRRTVNNIFGLKGENIITPKSYHLVATTLPSMKNVLKDLARNDFPADWEQYRNDAQEIAKRYGFKKFRKGGINLPVE